MMGWVLVSLGIVIFFLMAIAVMVKDWDDDPPGTV